MLLIDQTLDTLQGNLAFDEAMLESVEPSHLYERSSTIETENNDLIASVEASSLESLRLWEMPSVCVVMGRGSKEAEVNQGACRDDGVPVLRRCSGGASIVAGPGCLMYSLLLSLEQRPALRSIDVAHLWVMQHVHQAVVSIVPDIQLQGTCDLTLGERKFSGNAMRYKRDWLLYHGTLLYRFPLDLISRYLAMPPRQPEYRNTRSHADFLLNLDCESERLRKSLAATWGADQIWTSHPHSKAIVESSRRLLETKYA